MPLNYRLKLFKEAFILVCRLEKFLKNPFYFTENVRDKMKQEKLENFQIHLVVTNMWRYVISRDVHLPEDSTDQINEDEVTTEMKLEKIKAHIEDLMVVNEKVSRLQNVECYRDPVISEQTFFC